MRLGLPAPRTGVLIIADIPKKLSVAARTVLTFATTRPDHLVRPPKLPAAAARQVIRSLLKGGLVEEVPAPIQDTAYARRTNEDGAALMLRATALGLGSDLSGGRHPSSA